MYYILYCKGKHFCFKNFLFFMIDVSDKTPDVYLCIIHQLVLVYRTNNTDLFVFLLYRKPIGAAASQTAANRRKAGSPQPSK